MIRKLGTILSYDRAVSALFATPAFLSDKDVSVTQQQFAEECDINTIVKRFGLTGELPVAQRTPLPYEHFYGEMSYQDMLNGVLAAQKSFNDLPAHVRQRFGNDPAALVDFVSRSENRDEAIRLGMVPKPPEAPPNPAA